MICKTFIMLNLTVFPWTDLELKDITRISNECHRYYKSCLHKIIKKDYDVINVICRDLKDDK